MPKTAHSPVPLRMTPSLTPLAGAPLPLEEADAVPRLARFDVAAGATELLVVLEGEVDVVDGREDVEVVDVVVGRIDVEEAVVEGDFVEETLLPLLALEGVVLVELDVLVGVLAVEGTEDGRADVDIVEVLSIAGAVEPELKLDVTAGNEVDERTLVAKPEEVVEGMTGKVLPVDVF